MMDLLTPVECKTGLLNVPNSRMTRQEPRISVTWESSVSEQSLSEELTSGSVKGVFHPFRREIENSMVFKVDPELARRRAEDIAQFMEENMVKQPEQPTIEAPKAQKKKPIRRHRPPTSTINLTDTEIKATVDRLSQPTKSGRVCETDNSPRVKRNTKKQTGDAVFARLFTDSTEQPERRQSGREILVSSEKPATASQEADDFGKKMGEQKKLEIITKVIGPKDQFEFHELERVFRNLGIIEQCESIDNIPIIQMRLSEWELPNGKFDVALVKDAIFDALDGKNGKFESFVKNKIGIHFANMRFLGESPNYCAYELQSPKKRLTKETFERLLLPRPEFYTEKEEEEESYEPVPMSKGTLWILKKSPYAHEPMEERRMHLREVAETRALEQANETLELEKKKRRKWKAPRLTALEREQVAEVRARREADLYQYQSFKPEIMKYKDFLKVKRKMEDVERPKGWDENVKRHRAGYQAYLEKKKKESSGVLDLPRVRKKKLELITLVNEEVELPPEPQPQEVEVPNAEKRRGVKSPGGGRVTTKNTSVSKTKQSPARRSK